MIAQWLRTGVGNCKNSGQMAPVAKMSEENPRLKTFGENGYC